MIKNLQQSIAHAKTSFKDLEAKLEVANKKYKDFQTFAIKTCNQISLIQIASKMINVLTLS